MVHRVVERWRGLTGGRAVRDGDRRTLVACSGGADSSALVLALARHAESVVVGHVVHDWRPEAEAHGDRDACARLAAGVGLRFVWRAIEARAGGGNYEGAARRLRYEALEQMALEEGCRFVATAHHAEDQLETIVMRLVRGAGALGLSGIRARRRLAGGVVLVRPMLRTGRTEAAALCRECRWEWREDATNSDVSRRRAAIRATVVPALLAIEGRAAVKGAEAAEFFLQVAGHLEGLARELDARAQEGGAYRRGVLKGADEVVLLTWLRGAAERNGVGRDRIAMRALRAMVRAIRSGSGERRTFAVGGVKVVVEAESVRFVTSAPGGQRRA